MDSLSRALINSSKLITYEALPRTPKPSSISYIRQRPHALAKLAAILRYPRRLEYKASTRPRLSQKDSQTLIKLILSIKSELHTYSINELSRLVWVLGRFKLKGQHDFLCNVADTLLRTGALPPSNPSDLIRLSWGFSRLSFTCPSLWHAICATAGDRLDTLDGQQLSTLLTSLAHVGHADSVLLPRMSSWLVHERNLRGLSPGDLCTCAWALAKLRHHDPLALAALSSRFVRKRWQIKARGLSTFAWACASLHHNDPAVNKALVDVSTKKFRALTGQGLSNLLWALHTFRVYDARLYPLLATQVVERLDEMLPLALATIATAFARPPGHFNERLFTLVADRLAVQEAGATLKTLLAALDAYAAVRFPHQGLLDVVARRVESDMEGMKGPQMVHCLAAYARLCPGHPVCAPLWARLTPHVPHLDSASLARLCASLRAGVRAGRPAAPALAAALLDAVQHKVLAFTRDQAALVLHSLVGARLGGTAATQTLAARLAAEASALQPASLCLVAHAWAQLPGAAERLRALEEEVVQQLGAFDRTGLGLLREAFASCPSTRRMAGAIEAELIQLDRRAGHQGSQGTVVVAAMVKAGVIGNPERLSPTLSSGCG